MARISPYLQASSRPLELVAHRRAGERSTESGHASFEAMSTFREAIPSGPISNLDFEGEGLKLQASYIETTCLLRGAVQRSKFKN